MRKGACTGILAALYVSLKYELARLLAKRVAHACQSSKVSCGVVARTASNGSDAGFCERCILRLSGI